MFLGNIGLEAISSNFAVAPTMVGWPKLSYIMIMYDDDLLSEPV